MTAAVAPIQLPANDLTAAVTVESDAWDLFQAAIRRVGFVLRAVPHGPSQPPRYLLMEGTSLVTNRGILTDREHQVLVGISRGLSNNDIGRELFISEDTIKTHARRLFKKLGAHDRAHAVALGFRAGYLT